MAHDIYISHSYREQELADITRARLEAKNIKCWVDLHDPVSDGDYTNYINEAIRGAKGMVVIQTPRTSNDPVLNQEIGYAVAMGLKVFPYSLEQMNIKEYERIDRLADEIVEHILELASSHEYNVFISYRRELDDVTARFFYDRLKERDIDAFLDVVTLEEGRFDQRLFREIESAPNFLLLLSPGSLDRCLNEGDWLRDEISHAINRDRNVVPIYRNNFTFPNTLPDELAPLKDINAVPYSPDYVDATFDRVAKFLKSVETNR